MEESISIDLTATDLQNILNSLDYVVRGTGLANAGALTHLAVKISEQLPKQEQQESEDGVRD